MSMKSLVGKSILITGAAGGMGVEYARQLIELGAHIILSDLSRKALDKTASEMPTGPGKVLGVIESDMSSMEGCSILYDETKSFALDAETLEFIE